jgi:hypothetical protein
MFHNKNLKEFMTTTPALQKIHKAIQHTEKEKKSNQENSKKK